MQEFVYIFLVNASLLCQMEELSGPFVFAIGSLYEGFAWAHDWPLLKLRSFVSETISLAAESSADQEQTLKMSGCFYRYSVIMTVLSVALNNSMNLNVLLNRIPWWYWPMVIAVCKIVGQSTVFGNHIKNCVRRPWKHFHIITQWKHRIFI